MPYLNDNKLNIVISQTSGSADNTGKFPFTERIISGSNLFILTDANGNLTGSTSIPGGSFTNLTVTGALTASIISASNSITAAAATFAGPVTMSSTLSASGGIITSTISASSNVYVSGSLTVIGNIIGTIDSASVVSIAPINDGSTYYVTFVDSISGSRQLKTDADILSYTPLTNALTVGTSVSGSLTIGSKLNLVDSTASTSLSVGVNTTDTASLTVSSNAFRVIKGQGPGVDKVFTNLELSASNNVLFSNTTQATDWTNGALNVVGGVGIGKNLYVSGSGTIYGDLTVNGGDIVLSNTASNISLLDNVGGALDIKEGSNSYIKIATTNTTENVTFGTTPTVYIIKTTDNDLVTYDNGALIVGGGVGINKNLFVGGNTTTLGNSSITGSLTVNSTLKVNGNSILGDSLSDVNTSSGSLRVLNTTQATAHNAAALVVDGGVGIGKNLYVSGSTFLYGDLTIYGTGSVVNISSSTVIIGDNRVVLNAGTPIQRYAGIDVFDSGSGTYTNNVTSSLLWDALSDNWLLVSNNQTTGSPLTQSSAIMIGGPSGSFGNESLLTVNYIPKVQSTGKNLQNSALIDTGTLLTYAGTGISASQITASQLTVQYTGSITYATGVYITYTTGSFTTITITTGSSPGVGAQVPSSPTATGLAGQINVDNNFIYVYTNQVWKRVPLSTWLA
jgi:cytoskeletal protein CcmA (bactofilin family)